MAEVTDRGERYAIAAAQQLRSVLPFDAMQLLRHRPRRAEVSEVLRIGYGADSAWALQHLFVRHYGPGFTRALSPDDGLPPAISSVCPEFREEFEGTVIYRDYLRTNGYRDGLSMELFSGDEYVGIAHFSMQQPSGFTEQSRRVASSVQGLLAALILESPERGRGAGDAHAVADGGSTAREDAQRWYVCSATQGRAALGPAPIPNLLGSERFRLHLEQFRATGLRTARHLWRHERQLWEIELRALAGGDEIAVGATEAAADRTRRLTLQELRVLSLICAGHDDAAIAVRMRLSPRTVESHASSARHKLGARNRVEAAMRATTAGLTLPDPFEAPIDQTLGLS